MRRRGKRAAALVADRALSIIAPLVTPPRPTSLPAAPRVLLVRCDHIGDAIMATPVLEPLRAALAPSRLDVLVGPWATSLFEAHPAVDRVISYATPWWLAARDASASARRAAWQALPGLVRQLRANRYDIAIDLRGDLRQIAFFLVGSRAPIRVSTDRTGGRALLTHIWPYDAARHEVEKSAAVVATLGFAVSAPALDVRFDRTLRPELADALRAAAGPRGLVSLAFRSREASHSWPATHAARLIDTVRDRLGLGAVFLGGPDDRAFADTVAEAARAPFANLAGRTTLLESIAVFAATRAAVVVDSGPMHLAACSGVPIVALFGPSPPLQVRPWTDRARVLTDGSPCGCIHPRCDFTDGPGQCLAALTPDRVTDLLSHIACD
ncbi:MAG TPA: glycosyltransferase family 9 protein [Gemmatimonadaceae bacterium]|nr:glycosyltransferase family 9 protein [Gemmatimonadaceae bacterium]